MASRLALRLLRSVAAAAVLILVAGVAACQGGDETVRISIGSYVVTAELADTPDERRRGLMFREELEENHGMLFVFPESAPRSFWMRNTEIPLSIAYIDAGGTIVSIHDHDSLLGGAGPVPGAGEVRLGGQPRRARDQRCASR